MEMSRRRLLAATPALLAGPVPRAFAAGEATPLRLLTAGAFKAVALALIPAFEARSGVRVAVANDTAGGLVKRVQAGEPFDVLVLPPAGFAALAPTGAVEARSVRPVARVGIGVAVRAGAPRPALATPEQFREAVLRAARVAYIDPASGGSSGIYLDGLFQRLGIAEAVRAKAVLVAGGLAAERVAAGQAELALQQVSELLTVPGVEVAGMLPAEIQNYTVYAAGVAAGAGDGGPARAFMAMLASADAAAQMRALGMEPAGA